jgi:glucokinase
MSRLVLAGDIGGTKTILQLVRAEAAAAGDRCPALITVGEQTYPSQSYPDLAPMVRRFLDETPAGPAGARRPARACFGIAGPVINQTSELTNLNWSLSAERLQSELGIGRVTLLNDFAAIGYGLAGLESSALATLQAGAPDPTSAIAVIGAGTGLGEGFLVPDATGRYRPFPSEGGHTDFAARDALEVQLLDYLRRCHGVPQISVERVVSGPGIASIYQFLCERTPERETPAMARIRRLWVSEGGRENGMVDFSAAVSEAALAGSDGLCRQAMEVFVSAYGAEAGNLALKVLCKGGLYIAGGVAPKIVPLLEGGGFLEAFRNKGRMRPLMEAIPIQVVLNPKVGLLGAALCAVT